MRLGLQGSNATCTTLRARGWFACRWKLVTLRSGSSFKRSEAVGGAEKDRGDSGDRGCSQGINKMTWKGRGKYSECAVYSHWWSLWWGFNNSPPHWKTFARTSDRDCSPVKKEKPCPSPLSSWCVCLCGFFFFAKVGPTTVKPTSVRVLRAGGRINKSEIRSVGLSLTSKTSQNKWLTSVSLFSFFFLHFLLFFLVIVVPRRYDIPLNRSVRLPAASILMHTGMKWETFFFFFCRLIVSTKHLSTFRMGCSPHSQTELNNGSTLALSAVWPGGLQDLSTTPAV